MPDLSTEPCEKHEIINCVMCKEQAAPKPPLREHAATGAGMGGFRRAADMNVVEAKFEGRCSECGDDILLGDLIAPDESGDTARWKHKVCP